MKNYFTFFKITAVIVFFSSTVSLQGQTVTTVSSGRLFGTFNNPTGVAIDVTGNIYIADYGNNKIRKIAADRQSLTTFAGSGAATSVDGTGTAASIKGCSGVAVDQAGNVYVAEYTGNKIRKITPAGVVTTLAGSGVAGSADGTGTAATFKNPYFLVVDAANNVYVTDNGNNKIRKISPSGVVTTLAGSGVASSINGTGTAATFNSPMGIALDGSNNLYVTEFTGQKIRKITPDGVVTTVAGTGGIGTTDGAGTSALFYNPAAIVMDASGNLYVSEYNNHNIRKISPTGVVSTFAGHGDPGKYDGTGASAYFNNPMGMAFDAAGNIVLADRSSAVLRKITPAAVVSIFVGIFKVGSNDYSAFVGKIGQVRDIVFDASGNMYTCSSNSHSILKITPAGVVSTFAGTGVAGSADGNGTSASFNSPNDLDVDASGNIYVLDRFNNKVRKITPAGMVSTLAGSGTKESKDGTGTAASFNQPSYLAVDRTNGNVFVSDGLYYIRKITSAGVVSTFAGSNNNGQNIDGTGTSAAFSAPGAIAIDASGTIYVVSGNNIRKITQGAVVTTLAGSGQQATVNGTGTAASFFVIGGLVTDAEGNIFAAEAWGQTIRKITPAGVATTLAGNGTRGYTDGIGNLATFDAPGGITIDANSNYLYVADYANGLIRKVSTPSCCVALEKEELAPDFSAVYPNPSHDKLFIKDAVVGNSVALINSSGITVAEAILAEQSIDVSSLNPGIYFVKLKTEKGFAAHKFVKE